VWALGCILVELCTLSKAFESSSISKIILSIMRGAHTPVPACYSPELRGLATALLQVTPAARPSVGEVLSMPFVK
jgi:serine/threonine protein kinase